MKQILKFSILLLFFIPWQKVAGQDPIIIMGSQPLWSDIYDQNTLISQFYDPGGAPGVPGSTPDGYFDTSMNVTMTLQTAAAGMQLYVLFKEFLIGDRDTLWIYDGASVNDPLLGHYSVVNSPGEILATGRALTFVFHSDSVPVSGLRDGWLAEVYSYDPQPYEVNYGDDRIVLTCNADFYDAGGKNDNIGSPPSSSPLTNFQVFTSPIGTHIKCEFEGRFQASGLMKIYDGPLDLSNPANIHHNQRLIGQFLAGSTLPPAPNDTIPTFFSTTSTLCFVYEGKPGDVNKPGWKAHISCVDNLYEFPDNPCPRVVNTPDVNSPYYDPLYNYDNNAPDTIEYDCSKPVVVLHAEPFATGQYTNDYTVKKIEPYDEQEMLFSYDDPRLTVLNAQIDDEWLAPVNLINYNPSLRFLFFGQMYDKIYPSSNSVVSFNPHNEHEYCVYNTSTYIPAPYPPYTNTPYCYANSAYLVYEDVNPSPTYCHPTGGNNGKIRLGLTGVFPCRAYVVSVDHVGLYSCCRNPDPENFNTYQMVMMEGSGIIDIYIKHRRSCNGSDGAPYEFNGGRGVIGLQNKTSSQIVTPPGRDFGTTTAPITWNADNEHWRFTPVTPMPEFGELTWYENDVNPNNIISYSPTAKNQNLAVRPDDTTRYISEYIYVDALGNTIERRDTTVINVTKPKISVVSIKNDPVVGPTIDSVYCPNDSIFLKVDAVLDPTMTLNNISHYAWSTNMSLDTFAIDTVVTYLPPGDIATFYVTVTFDNMCTRKDSVKVLIKNPILPKITSRNFVTKEDYICKGDTLTLLATHPKTNQFEWNTGETSCYIEVHPVQDTLYIVTTKSDCHVSDTFKVVVLPLPPTSFTPDPIDIIMDNGIGTVTCTTPLSQGGYQLTWNFDDPNSPDNIVQGPDVVTHGYTRPRDYTITLTAVDANNCDSTYTDRVSVKVPDLFYVPSAFSPNNDEHNQKFQPSGQIVDPDRPYSMEIFNRYGMLVFSTNSPYDYWDGRNKKGELCPEGVYVYMISFYHINEHDNPDALPAVRKGTVTLLR